MNKTLLLSSAAAVAFAYGLAPITTFAQQDEQQQQEVQQDAEQQEAAQDQAQQEERAAQPDQDEQVAAECLNELQTTAQALAQEGYWITGWGQRWGWGTGPGGAGMGAAQDGVPPAATGTVPGDQAATQGAPATDMPAGPAAADPWGMGAMHGMASPRHQVRALFSAAHVLAYQGDQEGCEYVLARLHMTAEDHLEELREMGVDPQQVTDWRREAMAGAVPLTQLEPAGIHIDNLTGADVRNLQDEYLGSVSDIILDAEEAAPEYVVVARGGFLGIGEDHILVPWEDLRAAPQLHTLILDVSEADFEQAPAVDPDVAMDGEWMDEYRQQTDEYWQQHREG